MQSESSLCNTTSRQPTNVLLSQLLSVHKRTKLPLKCLFELACIGVQLPLEPKDFFCCHPTPFDCFLSVVTHLTRTRGQHTALDIVCEAAGEAARYKQDNHSGGTTIKRGVCLLLAVVPRGWLSSSSIDLRFVSPADTALCSQTPQHTMCSQTPHHYLLTALSNTPPQHCLLTAPP